MCGTLCAGCSGLAQLSGFEPALDHMTDAKPGSIRKDLDQCRIIAAAYAGIGADEIAYGLAGGAIVGGIAGLGIASVPGSAIGSALGGVSGVFRSGDVYRTVYTNCMRNRGHVPLN
jgi:hypothetical protein